MRYSRRAFLASVSVLPVLGVPCAAAAGRTLRAGEARLQLAPPDFPQTDLWAYNGQVPGEMLRHAQGETLEVRLDNALPQATTIHWHGLRLPNAMDGVPLMTQAAVPPGEGFDYRFRLRDAGTFWYHPHANSLEQISRGLAGVLIVDEAEPPEVEADHVIVLDDWRMTEEAEIHPSFDARHDMSHAGRLGNYITANAQPEVAIRAAPGARLRLRLVNTATARVFTLRFQGLRVWVAALDGMPLETPLESGEVPLAPAQRADLLVDVTTEAGGEAILASAERDGTYAMVVVQVAGPTRAPRPDPAPLPPNLMPEIALGGSRVQPLMIEGGAMRGLPEGALWNGTKMDMRQLAEAGQFWAFNGIAGSTEVPFVDAALGETVRIPMTNRTAFAHAMHLHGTHFREVLADGRLGPWRDTLLIAPDESREIAFVAENPGDWMLHCHMAAHQMSGMMNWIRVS